MKENAIRKPRRSYNRAKEIHKQWEIYAEINKIGFNFLTSL